MLMKPEIKWNPLQITHLNKGTILTTKTTFNIPISRPYIGEEEKQAVQAVLDSGQLVQGEDVAELEARFAEFCYVKHAIATSNGTTALTTALMTCGIGYGDEVIIPSYSFVATATSILSANATPVFVDIEPDTFCIDPTKIEDAITTRTKAIMPVHLYGHPAQMDEIKKIADKHDLYIVEDSAQAHGATIHGQPVGGWGVAGFSLYATKNMMSGEGGIVTTNDDHINTQARMIRNHGMSQQYYHEVIGFNFRLTNIMAAIGVEQIKRLPEWNRKRQENASFFSENLENVKVPVVREGYTHVFHQYTIVMPEGINRDEIKDQLNEAGIGTRVYYPLPIHCQPVFRDKWKSCENTCAHGHPRECPDLPVTIDLTNRVLSIPIHPMLTNDEREYIVETVNSLLKDH